VGDTAAATRDAEEAVALLIPLDDSWGLVHAKAMLGAVADAEHRFDEATTHLEWAVARSEALGFLGQIALHLTTLGRVRQRAGDQQEAVDVLNRALHAARRAGDPRVAATARIHLARARRALGDPAGVQALLEQNDHWYRASGEGGGALLSRGLLAALRAVDRPEQGTASLRAVLDQAEAAKDHQAQVVALDALARSAALLGEHAAARDLLRSADELAADLGHVLAEADRIDAEATRRVLAGSVT